MATDSSDAAEVEKLYQFGERLNESKDKSQVKQVVPFLCYFLVSRTFVRVCCDWGLFVCFALFLKNVGDYEGIIMAVKGGSVKAKQLAAQLIPRFFKFFPSLASKAMTAQFDLVEEDELGVSLLALCYFHAKARVKLIQLWLCLLCFIGRINSLY